MEQLSQVATVCAVVLAYFALNRESRGDLHRFLAQFFGAARRAMGFVWIVILTLVPLSIFLISIIGVWSFYTSKEPITRPELILLIAHCFNFFFYLGATTAMFKLWYQWYRGAPIKLEVD